MQNPFARNRQLLPAGQALSRLLDVLQRPEFGAEPSRELGHYLACKRNLKMSDAQFMTDYPQMTAELARQCMARAEEHVQEAAIKQRATMRESRKAAALLD